MPSIQSVSSGQSKAIRESELPTPKKESVAKPSVDHFEASARKEDDALVNHLLTTWPPPPKAPKRSLFSRIFACSSDAAAEKPRLVEQFARGLTDLLHAEKGSKKHTEIAQKVEAMLERICKDSEKEGIVITDALLGGLPFVLIEALPHLEHGAKKNAAQAFCNIAARSDGHLLRAIRSPEAAITKLLHWHDETQLCQAASKMLQACMTADASFAKSILESPEASAFWNKDREYEDYTVIRSVYETLEALLTREDSERYVNGNALSLLAWTNKQIASDDDTVESYALRLLAKLLAKPSLKTFRNYYLVNEGNLERGIKIMNGPYRRQRQLGFHIVKHFILDPERSDATTRILRENAAALHRDLQSLFTRLREADADLFADDDFSDSMAELRALM